VSGIALLDLVPLYKVYPKSMVEGITRGELAKQGHVNFETIRFYEQEGLLPTPPRSASGYRKYPGTAVRRLQFIRNAKELGFSLHEIRELLDLQVKSKNSCAEVCRKAKDKVADVDEKIRHLQEIRKALVRITNTCSGRGPISECSILQFLSEAKPA
jgi:MerR family transcriptional regulator, copper efflux regulator